MDKFISYYEQMNIVINNNINNDHVAIIIEPRNHEHLISTIKQVMSKLGDTWNLQIYGSNMNEELIKKNINGNFKFYNIGIDELEFENIYSLLLQNIEFWNSINEQHILMFQIESFIINDKYHIPEEYGFIGPPYKYGVTFNNEYIDCRSPVKEGFNLCGGFSYRKKDIMIECINKVSYKDIIRYRKKNDLDISNFENTIILPEDCFFLNAMCILGYDIPRDITSCLKFCFNQNYNLTTNSINILESFGINQLSQVSKINKTFIDNLCVHVLLTTIHSQIKFQYGSLLDELPEQKMAVRYLTGNEKVLELGSNIGRNSVIIGHILEDSSNFVTLESDPNTIKYLEHNKNINNLKFHIEASALSKKNLIQKDWLTYESDEIKDGFIKVNTITVDELNKKYNIEFDTLVLDCEGAFYNILRDMPEILNNIKLIIMENDYQDIKLKNFIDDILIKHNFKVDYQQRGGWGPCEDRFFEVWIK
tara:strand:- start:4369 stop:5802 length:1434 start_codon:yes stop_codon:yes gene_type:complete